MENFYGSPFSIFLVAFMKPELKTWFFSSIRRMYQVSKKGSSSTKIVIFGH